MPFTNHSPLRSRRGVTYGEVLFVAALCLVGACVLALVWSRSRIRSNNYSCERNLYSLGSALVMYSYDHDSALPPFTNLQNGNSQAKGLKAALNIYTDKGDWFCPSDPVARQDKYYLGIRHLLTSYAFPRYINKSGRAYTLPQIPVKVQFGIVWDAAGAKSSCEPGLWFAGNRKWASNHSDGHVNFVLADLSLHHLPALWTAGKLLP